MRVLAVGTCRKPHEGYFVSFWFVGEAIARGTTGWYTTSWSLLKVMGGCSSWLRRQLRWGGLSSLKNMTPILTLLVLRSSLPHPSNCYLF